MEVSSEMNLFLQIHSLVTSAEVRDLTLAAAPVPLTALVNALGKALRALILSVGWLLLIGRRANSFLIPCCFERQCFDHRRRRRARTIC